VKLVSPAVVRQMWRQGLPQFAPFAVTVLAIVLTDLLLGIAIGLLVSTAFILRSNIRQPLRRFVEKHLAGELIHIQLANQVSFLNRAALASALDQVPRGGQVLLDAESTDYIDPDVLELIREYTESTGPARGVRVSLIGFRDRYRQLRDQTQYVDYSTRELQAAMSPEQALEVLTAGHERFRTGRQLKRDLTRQRAATAAEQHPLAVVLSCIDSRTPAELIFDVGLGDIFSVRVAGNVTSAEIIGSIEYGCGAAGAKLVLVMGHTRCGAVTGAVDVVCETAAAARLTGCDHLGHVVDRIRPVIDARTCEDLGGETAAEHPGVVDAVARRNVVRVIEQIRADSHTLDRLEREERVEIVGALYDVATGALEIVRVGRERHPDLRSEAAEE
jgi:carbonic anhydrase